MKFVEKCVVDMKTSFHCCMNVDCGAPFTGNAFVNFMATGEQVYLCPECQKILNREYELREGLWYTRRDVQ